jgi:hypothetical protein
LFVDSVHISGALHVENQREFIHLIQVVCLMTSLSTMGKFEQQSNDSRLGNGIHMDVPENLLKKMVIVRFFNSLLYFQQ